MKKTISTLVFTLVTFLSIGQNLYTKTFGDNKNKPIIYLHGGPGYNSSNFEVTTAQKLAESGFYVIVYDRRGEGRSEDKNALFTFRQTFDDLNLIYKKYKIKKATLIGHSFGGIMATLFAEKNASKVQSIILVSAPVSLQKSFENIITKSKEIYNSKNDSVNLNYISMLENMDKGSIEYSSYCFGHAMQNGFYSPKEPTTEAKEIYKKFGTDETLIKNASKMTYEAPQGFWKNEKYTTIDLTSNLTNLIKQKLKIFALYGIEDGLYSRQQVMDLEKIIDKQNLKNLANCSHNVFIDQQIEFVTALKNWIK